MDGKDARDMEVKLGVECDRSPQQNMYISASLTQEYVLNINNHAIECRNIVGSQFN